MERKKKTLVKFRKASKESYIEDVSAVIDEVKDIDRQTPRRNPDDSDVLGTPGLTNQISRINAENNLASDRDRTSGLPHDYEKIA